MASFYGNITSTTRSHFQFERTYPNRSIMDNSANMDGVYLGNYVLVDYDTELSADWAFPNCHVYYGEDGVTLEFWTADKDLDPVSARRITYNETLISQTLYPFARNNRTVSKYLLVPANNKSYDAAGHETEVIFDHIHPGGSEKDVIYKVRDGAAGYTGSASDPGYPIADAIAADTNAFGMNSAIDNVRYGFSRGYDSTVWQKVYSGNPSVAHYVMIAELNTIVPTLVVEPDAPTISPIAPHFDLSSTNFIYKLHWQPTWGFRIKSAVNIKSYPSITGSSNGISGGDMINLNFNPLTTALPSDQTTRWTRPFYNTGTGQLDEYTFEWKEKNGNTISGRWAIGLTNQYTRELPGAIYYNKAGFNSEYISHSDVLDEINVTPSGLSGMDYHVHNVYYVPYNASNATAFNAQVQVLTNTYGNNDMYGRNHLYKVKDEKYVAATAYEVNTQYYIKSTNVAVNQMSPQVDTQELTIMLPSIGNSISEMWDLIYGSRTVNGGLRRNRNVEWIHNGAVYYTGSGLRLLKTTDLGQTYDENAAETVAGAINSMHDLIGMIIRPLNKHASDYTAEQIKSQLTSSVIYYMQKDHQYYRVGTVYEWSNTNVTSYNPSQAEQEPYKVPHDANHWPDPNTQYFYIENVPEFDPLKNYIMEQTYYSGRKYYYLTHVPSTVVTIGNVFHKDEYYNFFPDYSIEYLDGQNNKITVHTKAWTLSPDTQVEQDHRYYKVKTITPLNDSTRPFIYDADDITRQFYIVPDNAWVVATETYEDTAGQELTRPLTEEGYGANPNRYYIQAVEDGETVYIHTAVFTSSVTYYYPSRFESQRVYDPSIKYYYTIEGTKADDNQMYVSHTSYVPYASNTINSQAKFEQEKPYIRVGNDYQLATSYVAGTQYYWKKITWNLETISLGITADNATQVRVIDPTATVTYPDYPGSGTSMDKYWYYNPVGKTGAAEFYAIHNDLIGHLEYAIVELEMQEFKGFYRAGTLYYHVDNQDSIFYGSWLLDVNTEATADRVYYSDAPVAHAVSKPFWVGDEEDPGLEGLNEPPTVEEDGVLYDYLPLFVYQDNRDVSDDEKLPVGMKWNMNVALPSNSGIILRQYIPTSALIELKSFGRYVYTMTGSIKYLNEILSFSDRKTRSLETVRGVMNNMTDLINVFKDVKANEILCTNEWGQIVTTTSAALFSQVQNAQEVQAGNLFTGFTFNTTQNKIEFKARTLVTDISVITATDQLYPPTSLAVKNYVDNQIQENADIAYILCQQPDGKPTSSAPRRSDYTNFIYHNGTAYSTTNIKNNNNIYQILGKIIQHLGLDVEAPHTD